MELDASLSELEKRFLAAANQVVRDNGLELYDLKYNAGQSLLQLFVLDPKTQSAVIEDCVKVDRGMDSYLEEDWVPENLVLEVSSPGVYRALRSRAHFESAIGARIMVVLNSKLKEESLAGMPRKLHSKKLIGILKTVKDQEILLTIDEYQLPLEFEAIKKAQLEPDL